jgi:hypothetical protein
MSIEIIAVSGLVVAIIGALAACFQKVGLKKCHACCIDSDCRDNKNDSEFEKQLSKLEQKIEKNKNKINKIKEKRGSEPVSPVIEYDQVFEI